VKAYSVPPKIENPPTKCWHASENSTRSVAGVPIRPGLQQDEQAVHEQRDADENQIEIDSPERIISPEVIIQWPKNDGKYTAQKEGRWIKWDLFSDGICRAIHQAL